MNKKQIAQDIIQLVGGKDNVINVVHCATRLRFTLKNHASVEMEALKNISGVLSVLEVGGQLQVVIGNAVGDVYQEVVKQGEWSEGSKEDVPGQKQKLSAKIFELISGTFTPLLAPLAGAGMLKALLALLVMFDVMKEDSGAYSILSAAGNSVLYFLPIMIGITLAKKLGANPYMGGIIGAALLEPQFASLVETADKTDFFGIPVLLMDYSSSLVPSFVAVLAYAQLEKFLKRHIYQDLQLFLVPMLTLMIIVPLTVIAFGPFGIYVGEMIADVIN
ncbi:MAG: PTS transporter subunit EIIC, partial [Bacilli bacterium]